MQHAFWLYTKLLSPKHNSIQYSYCLLILFYFFLILLGVDELMKGAGKDATKLFDDIHAWVNYEQLLCKCFVGPLRTTMTINLDVSGHSSRAKSISQLASSTTPNGYVHDVQILLTRTVIVRLFLCK